jgi:Winged helix-turn helix
MSAPVPLGSDFDAAQLRKLARGSRDPDQTRRLLALAEIYAGGSRSDAARIGGVRLQIVRDWVLRFNADGVDGLLNGKAPGGPSILDNSPSAGAGHCGRSWRIRMALSRPSMASCAGASSIWCRGSSTSSGPRFQSKLSAGSCAPWGFASSRRARAIIRETRRPLRRSKKILRHRGGDSRKRGSRQADRDLVPR